MRLFILAFILFCFSVIRAQIFLLLPLRIHTSTNENLKTKVLFQYFSKFSLLGLTFHDKKLKALLLFFTDPSPAPFPNGTRSFRKRLWIFSNRSSTPTSVSSRLLYVSSQTCSVHLYSGTANADGMVGRTCLWFLTKIEYLSVLYVPYLLILFLPSGYFATLDPLPYSAWY